MSDATRQLVVLGLGSTMHAVPIRDAQGTVRLTAPRTVDSAPSAS